MAQELVDDKYDNLPQLTQTKSTVYTLILDIRPFFLDLIIDNKHMQR